MDKKLINHIQFLRAISVLLVFFYHLKLFNFEYGYIGVDIFFIISGYVITARIYNEYIINKEFNFVNFYKKRIKRIYPVLFCIFSICIIFIIFFQPLDLFLENFKVFIFTLLGVSNLYYLFSTKDYFDTVFDDPFAHSWSLGVEEQFYILFPIFLIILLKNINKINLNIIILVILIIANIIFLYFFSNSEKIIFYSPLFRFWQFLLGTLTFLISIKFKNKIYALSLISFLILIIFIMNGNYISKVNLTVFSSILACFFILFYETNKFGKVVFENKAIVFLGNISYSFYLWHLPIIYFYNLYFVDHYIKIFLIFLLTFLLSTLSFLYIEQKFRYKNFSFRKKNIFLISICLLITFLNISYFAFQKSYENKIKASFKNLIYSLNFLENSKNYTNRTVFYKISIDGNQIYRYCTENSDDFNLNKKRLRKECINEKINSKKILFLEGNSHSANFIPMINSIKTNDDFYFEHKTNLFEKIDFKRINSLSKVYDEVIYSTHIDNLHDLKIFKKLINNFNSNIKLLILGPVPNIRDSNDPLKCFIKSIDCTYSKILDFEKRDLKNFYLNIDKTLENYKNIYFYNPYDILCPNDLCYSYDSKKDLLTHRDKTHLTIEGSLLLTKHFENYYNSNLK